MEKFEGAMTALITPKKFTEFDRLVKYQIENGINGLVPCGTTGQSPTLSWDEHDKIISRAVNAAKDKGIPVIAGAGSNNTAEAVRATVHAYNLHADATLHVTGYYNCPSQQGFADYFSRIAEVAPDCGVIIYNIPGRGHPLIGPEVMVALALEYPNIIGTKDATGGTPPGYSEDGSFWKAVRREADINGLDMHQLKILSGDDPATCRIMTDPEIRGTGVISVWSNIFPHAYAEMCEHALMGEYEEAQELDNTLRSLNNLVGLKVPRYDVKIGKRYVPVENDVFRNPECVHRTAYELGMISDPDMRSPMGFLPREAWEQQVGPVLWEMHEGQYGEFLFNPIKEFFGTNTGDRLMKYRKEK